jgi:hypothetical protein
MKGPVRAVPANCATFQTVDNSPGIVDAKLVD